MPPYMCRICGKFLETDEDVYYHYRAFHPEILLEVEQEVYDDNRKV